MVPGTTLALVDIVLNRVWCVDPQLRVLEKLLLAKLCQSDQREAPYGGLFSLS